MRANYDCNGRLDVLISLVEAKPVLWDKTLDTFKYRNLTRDAWREVCCALKNDFEVMEDKEKKMHLVSSFLYVIFIRPNLLFIIHGLLNIKY